MQTAFKITDHKDASKNIQDEITLSYEERFIRRKKLTTDNGTEFLVNLEETVSMDESHYFELENGNLISSSSTTGLSLNCVGTFFLNLVTLSKFFKNLNNAG